jgi:hypothetical protein
MISLSTNSFSSADAAAASTSSRSNGMVLLDETEQQHQNDTNARIIMTTSSQGETPAVWQEGCTPNDICLYQVLVNLSPLLVVAVVIMANDAR